MRHEIIKRVILDLRQVIKNAEIIDRDYHFEERANYILVGVRRSGKSTMLYKKARDLISSGVDWNQICYVNFEDDRLMEFTNRDFDDIIESAHEFTDKKIYYFFDEIQNIDGWERFARRLADHKEQVYITGSNAKMLSSEMEERLGGRYISMMIMPFSFSEALDYKHIPHDADALLTTSQAGQIRGAADEYLHSGGLPESLDYKIKRDYIQSVYDKVLLGDIVSRNRLKNPDAMRLLMKKTAEAVMHEVSFNKLAGAVKSTGLRFSTDAAIVYAGYAEDAYLIFRLTNYVAKFSEKESTPRFYFIDNGFLSLFLIDKNSALLENAVADRLLRLYGKKFYYFKSRTKGIDIDFYIPEENLAVQVAYSLDENSYDREIESLIKFSESAEGNMKYLVVTYEDERKIETNGITIDVIPLYKFLMSRSL